MAEGYLAGVGLRLTQFATRNGSDGNALSAFDATECPNGSLALVAEDNTLFVLDKFSTVAAGGVAVIAAIGGGRWIAIASGDQGLYSSMVRLVVATGTPNTGAVTQSQWRALPSNANQYSLGVASSPLWSMSTSSGVMTYVGPTRQFLIFGSITITNAAATHAFSFSHSDSPIIGTTNNSDFENQFFFNGNDEANLNFIGAATVSAGDTIQGAVRNLDSTGSFNIDRYQLAVMPAS